MRESNVVRATESRGSSDSELRWLTPTLILLVAFAISVRCYFIATATTEPVVPWIVAVIFTWAFCLIALVVRSPTSQLRFSDPGVLILLWAAYYFITPAMSWLSEATFDLEGLTVSLTPDLVASVQMIHILFLIAFIAAYIFLLPRFGFRNLTEREIASLPRAKWWILIGLLPTAIEVLTRLVETGSIRPEVSYLEAMTELQQNVDAARSAGGSEYVWTQLFTKVQFYGRMVLGFGFSLYLVRCWHSKQWWRVALFHAAFPLLLYFSSGARSTAAYPFIIALIVTDYLAGPISWRYIVTITLAGFCFFYVYGFFRMHQDEDLTTALSNAVSDFGESRELDYAEAENSFMLLKEAYAVQSVGQKGATGIGKDIVNALLLPVPQQITGDKAETISDSLSRDLIGDKLFEEGFALAGSLVAEGYLAEGALGVCIIAAILGLLVGGSVRVLARSRDARGTALWKILLLATLTSQAVLFIRSELGILISYYLYYVLLPAALFIYAQRRYRIVDQAGWGMAVHQIADANAG